LTAYGCANALKNINLRTLSARRLELDAVFVIFAGVWFGISFLSSRMDVLDLYGHAWNIRDNMAML